MGAVVMMVIGAIATSVLMFRAAGWVFRPNLLIVWALVPYAMMVAYAMVGQANAIRRRASF